MCFIVQFCLSLFVLAFTFFSYGQLERSQFVEKLQILLLLFGAIYVQLSCQFCYLETVQLCDLPVALVAACLHVSFGNMQGKCLYIERVEHCACA